MKRRGRPSKGRSRTVVGIERDVYDEAETQRPEGVSKLEWITQLAKLGLIAKMALELEYRGQQSR
jgi:hypothetical protein